MSTPARVAINGLGRVGRAFLKLALTRPELDVVAINELGDPESIAYLMRFDSAYGRYDRPVAWHDDGQPGLSIADRRIAFLRQPDPAQLPWGALNIDIVVEATGVLETYAKARSHLKAGARRVVLAAPAKDEDGGDARTVLMGVNAGELRGVTMTSNGSCTTNSASPVIQILNEATRPPDHRPRHAEDEQRERAGRVDGGSSRTGQQGGVQPENPVDRSDARDLIPEDEHGAGHANEHHPERGGRADPVV